MINNSSSSKLKFLILILATGCASKTYYKTPSEKINLPPPAIKKSLTVKFGLQLSSRVYWSDEDYRFSNQEKHHELELQKYLEKSNYFSKFVFRTPSTKFIKKNDHAGIQEYFETDSFSADTDLQMNLYTTGEAGHAYIILPYMAWMVVHMGTFGLVPLWFPEGVNYSGDIRTSENKILYTFEKSCSASVFSWSPLALTGPWRTPNDERTSFSENCIFSILNDIRAEGVL